LASGLVVGGIAGGYVISQAASATPTVSAAPSPSSGSTTDPSDHGGRGGCAGASQAARGQDLQQVATAIGITVAQLQTEMSAGKTIAAIATEHHVAVATVISTLVSAENSEIDAAVTAGRLTQAQATQLKTMTQQRVGHGQRHRA
jgi:hypothetical protein